MPTTPTIRSTAAPMPDNTALKRQLRERLLSLSYRAYLQVVTHLLAAQGYSRVCPAARVGRKGPNQGRGWDIEAELETGVSGRLRTLVQVKQFGALPVQLRSVDELRGVCLRSGAHQALLVTVSTFSRVAEQAARAEQRIVPVRLIGGDTLLDLLVAQGIGVQKSRSGRGELDEPYFGRLSERFPLSDRRRGKGLVTPRPVRGGTARPPYCRSVSVRIRVHR